jgi:hypothetical protein
MFNMRFVLTIRRDVKQISFLLYKKSKKGERNVKRKNNVGDEYWYIAYF